MATPEENRANLMANRKKIYALEKGVMENKKNAYLNRSMSTVNMHLIMRNREAAFGGNRQLANYNTDMLFSNRRGILHALPDDTVVQKNFKDCMLNKVKLEFLEHRSELNTEVMDINKDIQAVNESMMAVNKRIMALNEEIVNFNAKKIAENKEWLDSGVPGAGNPTPDGNAAIIAANAAKIAEVDARMKKNAGTTAANRESLLERRAKIEKNTEDIYARRKRIEENAAKIKANADRVAALFD